VKELNTLLTSLDSIKNPDKALVLIYVAKAWYKISLDGRINEELTFDNFYNHEIKVKKLELVFKKLAENIHLFSIYKFDVKNFQDNTLVSILNYVKNTNKLPNINDMFFSSKGKLEYSVSNQIAELGIKLLDESINEIYVPFTNGFAYANYTDKKIFADNQWTKSTLLCELINIIEDKEIVFKNTNSLEDPAFINPDAPHLLKQFDNVLSFPPFGVRKKIDTSSDKFHRFNFHKGIMLDLAYFEHILAQTKSKAVVLMPVGFTYRASAEENFRKHLVDNNYLEAVIQLPPNLHSATSIETTFLIINKQKKDEKTLFINLKDESFIKRDGRQLVFKSVDEIVKIYKNNTELENISILIPNEEIKNNNYSFAVDRYIIDPKVKKLQSDLSKFELNSLETIADIRRAQLFKDEEEGLKIYEISPSDFNQAGFTLDCGKEKQIGSQEKRLQTYQLEPYDVLLSTKGTIGKVAVIGEITQPMVASQAIQVIRLKCSDKKEKAIVLYMFLKSSFGQSILSSLVAGVSMPQIATAEIKKLNIPVLTEEQENKAILDFTSELEMYNEINRINLNIQSIHRSFLRS